MGKCLANLLLTRIVNYRRTQPYSSVLTYADPTRPAIEAQIVASNSHKVRLIMSGAAGVGGILAASPPHKFSFRPNLDLGTHTVLPYSALSRSSVRRSSPASPAARVVIGSPSHSTSQLLPPTASQQASNVSSLHWAALIRPQSVGAASTTHTRLVMTAACLGFEGQANP
jgi:hypothetical protein